ncbi:MAG: hypothetical protein M1837_000322 [Sclerophora amabilis]|nr:MAG: hypothetical protein M1837_000322 [Sclerophora amabilis]
MTDCQTITLPAGVREELLNVSTDLGAGTAALDHEAAILEILGKQSRIVRFIRQDERGLCLEYAANGDLARHMINKHDASEEERIKWCRQTAEATVHMHRHGVIHCDLKLSNLLLDDKLDVKVCGFQGQFRAPGGAMVPSLVAGQAKFCLRPWDDPVEQTDLFALGSCIYHIMQGGKPFPDLDDYDDDAIEARFRSREFGFLEAVEFGDIIHRCWEGKYRSAQEVLVDLDQLHINSHSIASKSDQLDQLKPSLYALAREMKEAIEADWTNSRPDYLGTTECQGLLEEARQSKDRWSQNRNQSP